jgi:putative membrane protein
MIIINRPAKDMGGSLGLFRAFLQGWAAEDPKELEEMMEKISIDRDVCTKLLEFNMGNKTINLVIPEIHPGPFYPVGSSNLPMQISDWFHEKKISSLVFHGISNHELNLPSKNQVKNYLSKFNQFNTIDSGKTCSIPCIAKKGKATASCIAFGKTSLLMLTLSPYGMEDFPSILKQKIEKTSIEMGREVIIVDAHNSQGSHISDNDLEDLIAAGEKALKEVVKLKQYEFKIGFAHSSNLEVDFGQDIGPAGFGVITIEIKDNYFSMISFDSNNIIIGLRGKLIEKLQNTRTSIVEICTTDTHITAGKVLNRKGYIALGERTELDLLHPSLEKLINDSIEDVTKTNYQVKKLDSTQKVIGGKLINDFSTAINRSIYFTKIGVISMIVFSILLTALTALS